MVMVIDFVFALDSIITAVGMTAFLPVMIAANVVAVGLMILAARPISGFIAQHPTVKMLALAFILLVGVALVASTSIFRGNISISPSPSRSPWRASTC